MSEFVQIYDTTGQLLHYKFDNNNANSTKHFAPDVQIKLPFGDERRRLGGGGFGEVYKVEGVVKTSMTDEGEMVNLAMKVMDIGDRDFSREVEVPRNRDLREGLVHLYGSFTCYDGPTDKMLCLLFERADKDLKTLLRDPEPKQDFNAVEACLILVETLAFYHASHEGSTAVHYDLKPENILVFPVKRQGEGLREAPWKIGDFGMAQIRTTGEDSGVDPRSIGSKMYLPPEWFNSDDKGSVADGKHGKAFDVWAMGCIVLEVLTWEYSGRERDAVEIFEKRRETRQQRRQCNYVSDQDHYKSFWNSEEVVDEKLKQLRTHKDYKFRVLVILVTAMLNRDPRLRFDLDSIVLYGLPDNWEQWIFQNLGLIDSQASEAL